MSTKSKGQMPGLRIGIYSGTFDPVHAGHIAFALQAVKAANLDELYLVPERQPRGKHHVTHFAHRVAMARRAVRPYTQLGVLEIEDKVFSVAHTLPRLRRKFPGTQLVFVCGSDVVAHMQSWSHVEELLRTCELCVGRREKETAESIRKAITQLPIEPVAVTVLESHAPAVSSSQIRAAIRENRGVRGLLHSVQSYASQEWLYV